MQFVIYTIKFPLAIELGILGFEYSIIIFMNMNYIQIIQYSYSQYMNT